MYQSTSYDVAVIGAGHAGIEAALAVARLGLRAVCFTINADAVGNLPCNPSIGGTAKGILVREVDALGGEMGRAADRCGIQFRMLNRSKGPAVRSPRSQTDRYAYRSHMKSVLENTPNLYLKQAEIVKFHVKQDESDGTRRITAVETSLGAVHHVGAVVVATGTFLGGKLHIGDWSKEGGPDGMFAANELTQSLVAQGMSLRRFKTGTPPRVLARSLNLSAMSEQHGESDLAPFSYTTPSLPDSRAVCYLTYTNAATHQIIRDNLHRSPLFSGDIVGVGPRYCPSIEDKVVRFADKERHPVFVEPCGLDTGEMYLQGLSSSLPEEVQIEIVRSIEGLENAEFVRPGYAIEYDCADPLDFDVRLEHKSLRGLYGAGQFIGTSGYEEAAALGLVAGANAAFGLLEREPLLLTRSDAYIGVLIDDLVTKGTTEPYRMMTSRAEHRLIMRNDNADIRLCPIAAAHGLITAARLAKVTEKYQTVSRETHRLQSTKPLRLNDETATAPTLAALLRRPDMDYSAMKRYDPNRPTLALEVIEQVEIDIKYEGYIERARSQAAASARADRLRLPPDLPYSEINGLRIEARQKLAQVRPETVGQASRISGVNPADIAALLIWLENR